MPLSINRIHPGHNPELASDEKDHALEAWTKAGGPAVEFEAWWQGATTSRSFDSVKALMASAYQGGADAGFHAWWAELAKKTK